MRLFGGVCMVPKLFEDIDLQILPVSTNKNKNFEHFFIFPKRDRAEIANQQLGQAKLPRTVRDMDWAVLGGEIRRHKDFKLLTMEPQLCMDFPISAMKSCIVLNDRLVGRCRGP